jgi:hypothetical protein
MHFPLLSFAAAAGSTGVNPASFSYLVAAFAALGLSMELRRRATRSDDTRLTRGDSYRLRRGNPRGPRPHSESAVS